MYCLGQHLPHRPDIEVDGLSGAAGAASEKADVPGDGRVIHSGRRRPVEARNNAGKGVASREAGAGVMVIYQAQ